MMLTEDEQVERTLDHLERGENTYVYVRDSLLGPVFELADRRGVDLVAQTEKSIAIDRGKAHAYRVKRDEEDQSGYEPINIFDVELKVDPVKKTPGKVSRMEAVRANHVEMTDGWVVFSNRMENGEKTFVKSYPTREVLNVERRT